MRTKVKICGITTVKDAIEATEAGAQAIGLIFAESPRRIEVGAAAEICRKLSGQIDKVGVFVNHPAEEIIKIAGECQLTAVQIYNWSDQLTESLKNIKIIQAFRVKDETGIKTAENSSADLVLLDAYREGSYGGTGQQFDWKLIKKIEMKRDYYLSGGLNADNIYQAIIELKPYGVDASSGLELYPGKKDSLKIKKFFSQIKKAESFIGLNNE